MGAGALGQAVDEFNGDNFDHGPLGFIGGGYIALWTTGGRPILQQHGVPEGTPKWGSGWKKAMHENYLSSASIATHGSVMSYRDSYLDLDPTYRDVYGNPLLRLTFDFHDNEHKMSKLRHRQGGADREGDEAAVDQGQLARRPLLDRAVPDDAQHRRRGDGRRSRRRASSTAICSRGTCPTCS